MDYLFASGAKARTRLTRDGIRHVLRRYRLTGLLGLAVAATPLMADPVRSPDELAGHYYMSGMMEVGSELLLRPDGHFQWMISYGAVDRAVEGDWTSDGRNVLLSSRVPAANDVQFHLGKKTGWGEREALLLSRRWEQKALDKRTRGCPLKSLPLEGSVDHWEAPSGPPRRDVDQIKAEVDRAHDVAQASLDRLKARPDWQQDKALVTEAEKAITDYRDKQAMLRDALHLAGMQNIQPAALDLPRECLPDDWERDAASFRGVAIAVIDATRNQSGDGIQVEARYDRGAPDRDIVTDGYAFLPLRQGQRITGITLRVPGAAPGTQVSLPVTLGRLSVQQVNADLGSLIMPAFGQLTLAIHADGSLAPEGPMSRVVYRKPVIIEKAPPTTSSQSGPISHCSPVTGAGSSEQTVPPEWQREVAGRILRAQTYPREAVEQRIEGTVLVKFRVNRADEVKSLFVSRSSGSALLDAAAIQAARRAQPLPPLPCGKPDELDLILPIRFTVQD